MPFRKRQEMQSYAAGKIYFSVGTPNPDTGIVEYSDVCQQDKLPDVEMTDLRACIKAGVSLEKTNCKLISPDTHKLANRLSDFKELESNSNPNPNPSSESED